MNAFKLRDYIRACDENQMVELSIPVKHFEPLVEIACIVRNVLMRHGLAVRDSSADRENMRKLKRAMAELEAVK